MIYGTAYFRSLQSARKYYAAYDISPAEVAKKVRRMEIYIGKPPISPNNKVVLLDNGLRYGIEIVTPSHKAKPGQRGAVRNPEIDGRLKENRAAHISTPKTEVKHGYPGRVKDRATDMRLKANRDSKP